MTTNVDALLDACIGWLTDGDGSGLADITRYLVLVDDNDDIVSESLDGSSLIVDADSHLTNSGGVATNASPIDFALMPRRTIQSVSFTTSIISPGSNRTITLDFPTTTDVLGDTFRIPANALQLGISAGTATPSSYAITTIADLLARDSAVATSGSRWAGLLDTTPTELALTDYARVNCDDGWNTPALGERTNQAPDAFFDGFQWPTDPGVFGSGPATVAWVATFDAATAGNELLRLPLASNVQVVEGSRLGFLTANTQVTAEAVSTP